MLPGPSYLDDLKHATERAAAAETDFRREIAQRITVMHLGQVLAEGSVTEIEQNPKVKEAYLGSRAIS